MSTMLNPGYGSATSSYILQANIQSHNQASLQESLGTIVKLCDH